MTRVGSQRHSKKKKIRISGSAIRGNQAESKERSAVVNISNEEQLGKRYLNFNTENDFSRDSVRTNLGVPRKRAQPPEFIPCNGVLTSGQIHFYSKYSIRSYIIGPTLKCTIIIENSTSRRTEFINLHVVKTTVPNLFIQCILDFSHGKNVKQSYYRA